MSTKPDELRLTDAIRQCGVKRFSRQGPLLRIDHSLEKNGKVEWTTMLFEAKPQGFYATLQDFELKCHRQKTPRQLVQQIIAALSLGDDYYENALRYYAGESNQSIIGTAIKFPDFFEDINDTQQQQEQQGQETSQVDGDEQEQEED